MYKPLWLAIRGFVCALALVGIVASNAAAASWTSGPGGPGGDLPLTPAQQQNVATKAALGRQEAAVPGSVVHASKAGPLCAAPVGGSVAPLTGCGSAYGFVTTYTRKQLNSYYCGVATAQVISNYFWNEGSGQDRYSQQWISDNWTKTDANGQTTAWYEAAGLQGATANSPRWTAGFTYYYKVEPNGSAFDADVRLDVGYYNVPLTASVAPRDPGFPYWLVTWQNVTPVVAGHWITLTGWVSPWDGTENPTVNYDDSAIGTNGTAAYDPVYDVWQIVNHANSQHAAGYVVY
jgi:hypothetical protein